MTLDEQAREVVERLNDIRAAHPFNRQVELDVIAAALRQQWEEADQKVQQLCNDECLCYKQDKSGCTHPDADAVHNGNVVLVAGQFQDYCRQRAQEGKHE